MAIGANPLVDEKPAPVSPDKGDAHDSQDEQPDWGAWDDYSPKTDFFLKNIFAPMRSNFLLDLIQNGLPKEQTGLFYFFFIQFYADIAGSLRVYSTIPALLMWYYPDRHFLLQPRFVYVVTDGIDFYTRRSRHTWKEEVARLLSWNGYSFLLWVDFRDITKPLEGIFGPASTWPAALLPIVPGMFLRALNERPNSINGFIPEKTDGVWMALFIRACAAVLPLPLQWWLWAAYAAPSIGNPVMFADFIFCTFSWVFTNTSIMGAYAIWLWVNQYWHPKIWFKDLGGGPSVVMKRERRGLLCYIATIIGLLLLEYEVGPVIAENELLVLPPQKWIPLALILVIGSYLLKYGLMLRIYKFQHSPLRKGENIRLLRLRAQPRLPNAPIQCDMIHCSLRQPPQYYAISHRWEPESADKEMILIDGGLFPVSRSIYSLLLTQRSLHQPQYLWIDSICINQGDTAEKSRQVSIMRNIFEEAEIVLGWLGDDPDTIKAFNLVKRICKTTNIDSRLSLHKEPNSGWAEFEKLVSGEFFERAWIVQELCVGKQQILCCGDQAINWKQLVQALVAVIPSCLGESKNSSRLLYRPEIVNVFVIDEIRSRIASVDLIKLKDALKLGLGFKATLPVDKVYAFLGLVDERHTPLLHPKFGSSISKNSVKALDPNMIAYDICNTLQFTGEIFAAMTGTKNSRRARAILSLGSERAIRYTRNLMRDTKRLMDVMDGIVKNDHLQFDYSDKSTVQLVYTYVARDLIKQHSGLSFIRFGALKLCQSQRVEGLPSWVPDWSVEIDTYTLPWRLSSKTDCMGSQQTSQTSENENSVFQDGGPDFLFVKGSLIGTIRQSTALTRPFSTAAQGAEQEEIERDFIQLQSNFDSALQLAREHCKASYQTEQELWQSFCTTVTADSDICKSSSAVSMRLWDPDSSMHRSVSAALRLLNRKDDRNTDSGFENPDGSQRSRDEVLADYAFIRATQSSANSKFAHLTSTDIIPSFSQYRRKGNDEDSGVQKTGASSMLDTGSVHALSVFAPYADFSMNRSFIVTNSGFMGIAPMETKDGDEVIQIQTEGRIVWLVLREQENHEPESEFAGTVSETPDAQPPDRTKDASPKRVQTPPYSGTFRLVGEAFVNKPDSDADQVQEMRWLRLW